MKTLKKLFVLTLCFVLITSNIPFTNDNMATPYGHYEEEDDTHSR